MKSTLQPRTRKLDKGYMYFSNLFHLGTIFYLNSILFIFVVSRFEFIEASAFVSPTVYISKIPDLLQCSSSSLGGGISPLQRRTEVSFLTTLRNSKDTGTYAPELMALFDESAMSSTMAATAVTFCKHQNESNARKRSAMIIFDKDGTLGDCTASLRKWILSMQIKIGEYFLSSTSTNERAIILEDFNRRMGWNSSTNSLVPSAPIAAGTWEIIIDLLYQFLRIHAESFVGPVTLTLAQEWNAEICDGDNLHGQDVPVIADLREMILECRKQNYLVGICTSDNRVGTKTALGAWNVADLVDGIICGDEVEEAKPSSLPLQELCTVVGRKLNIEIEAADCIVVGDTSADTGMARAANAGFCVGVLTGSGTTSQLLQTGAHLVLPDVGYIPKLLDAFEIMSHRLLEEE